MSIVTTVTTQNITWDKPKLFYKNDLDETTASLTATSTASGYDVDNIYNRLETSKWISGVTTTQYITLDSGYVAGALTHIDSDDQGDTARGVWGDGTFIYLANGTGGLHSYSVDGAGALTHIDFDDQGDTALSVWGDGTFIYLANDTGGLHSYSVDGAGALTHINFDDQGNTARGVWGDGSFIYLADGVGGLRSYSVDEDGAFTHIDSDDQGDDALSVWGDGTFIYLADLTAGLKTFSDSSVVNSMSTDYLIIHGHNLYTAGATVTLQYSDDRFLSDVNDAFTGEAVTADTTYLKEFTAQTDRYWRLKIENATVAPQIEIMYWGETVELEYCENSFDPNAFDDKATVNVSQTGYVLGIYEKFKERSFTLSWNEAESDLYDKIVALVDEVGRENFVIAWETESHSDDVFLVRIAGDFNNPYVRQAQYRDIKLQLTGRVE